MIRVGIIGGAGYGAGELIRLLLAHPEVEIAFVRSVSHGGHPLHLAHADLFGETSLNFTSDYPSTLDIDVLFLCSQEQASSAFLDSHTVSEEVKIIDLSPDFRLEAKARYAKRHFIYGLPELHRNAIRGASAIANPGCFATLIQLALLPLVDKGLLNSPVHVHAITGSTGAGASLKPTTHFTWRSGNISIYKPFAHQHLAEIDRGLRTRRPDSAVPIYFIPVRGDFTRGIFGTLYTECELGGEEVRNLYEAFYADHPFTFVTEMAPDLKQVVNTNKAFLHLEKHGDLLLITGALDNLLKGAAGQAVQNMNLLFGFNERTGLRLKPSAF